MKRIIFVDDQPLVLQGLQRMLRSMRQEWEMEFVDSGAKALERMAAQSFDVVVSDMRMPSMNGVQLLERVAKLYPKMVRLILSGYADRDLTLQCVGTAHQFIAKPCDPAALKSTIERASHLDDSLKSERLKEFVGRMEFLPSVPAIYVSIVEKLNSPDATIEDVGNIIIKDVGMTAKILKLVNSAFFGMGHPVSSPLEASFFIGVDTIKALVLCIHAFAQFDQRKLGGLDITALMDHSMRTGARAKFIAQQVEASPKVADDCFVSGLLHDTGKLVLAANHPEDYARVIGLVANDGVPWHQAEQQIFGADHGTVGGYLLGLWGLPVPVVEAIALHHTPGVILNPVFSPLAAVHVANALERTDQGDAQLDNEYVRAVGLEGFVEEWRTNLGSAAA